MTTHNRALFKLLLQFGATEEQAEAAAAWDTSDLATKTDLAALELKLDAKLEAMQAAIIKWNLAAMGVLTTIFTAIMMLLRVTT